jgi:hypothetical protein
MSMGHWQNDGDTHKLKYLDKNPFQYLFAHHESHMDLLWTEVGLCDGRLMTNHLSHGMALCLSLWCNKGFSELSSSTSLSLVRNVHILIISALNRFV